MYCTGNELKLIECEREIHNHNFCSHQNDVGIMCCKLEILYDILYVVVGNISDRIQ